MTERAGGVIFEDQRSHGYASACDPRLDDWQALDKAFAIVGRMRQTAAVGVLRRSRVLPLLVIAGCATSGPSEPPRAAPAPVAPAPVVPPEVSATVVAEEAFRITVPSGWHENVADAQAMLQKVRAARSGQAEDGARCFDGKDARLMLLWSRTSGPPLLVRAREGAYLGGLHKTLEPGVVRWDVEETRVTTSVTIEVVDKGTRWRGRASVAVDNLGSLWTVSAMCIGATIPPECAAAVDTLSIPLAEARLLPLEAPAKL